VHLSFLNIKLRQLTKSNNSIKISFISGQNFQNIIFREILCNPGQNIKFNEAALVIDLNHFINNKQEIEDSTDIILELIPIQDNKKLELKMLHFFINTGINDNAYYWNELVKCIKVYVALKRECPTLDGLNIGGGFPIKNSLAFEYDYQYMIDEIINQIKIACDEAEVDVPNIFTEFGSYTVGESGGAIYQILYQKQQNDREKWNMIDSSFITTLPDTWAINRRFIMLAVNRWNDTYERVLLGGMTCDSDDYYNSEQNMNAIYLPKYNKEKPLYIGFFNTGAYQETIGGYGGLHHCLIPQPKHILIDRDENGILATEVFSEQQTAEEVLEILGYNK
jgi:arginine decarboxylase